MAKKKSRKVVIGIIRGTDVLKATKPIQDIPFRTGGYMTKKDRPRKKYKPRDVAFD